MNWAGCVKLTLQRVGVGLQCTFASISTVQTTGNMMLENLCIRSILK